ncbi:hypothetical protein JTE90_005618 [Oedothorax gibbosus]|uniref:Uncharacterized protein n=1 Tax=Oedothorax gibbosus TaxID=931172 RepID=A0AAV6UGM9_9ARAC|nr:hypothetical protein JTE90_005618 [Oedothorax gibbosus]
MMSLANIPTADDSTTASASLLATATEKSASESILPEPDDPPVKKSKKSSEKPAAKKQKQDEKGANGTKPLGLSKSKQRKLLRNSGQEYVTKLGKVVKAKIFDNKDCGCSRKCKKNIAVEDRQKCFDKFWKFADFGKQNAYLSGLVTREAVKQHRPRLNCTNRGPKGVTYQYRVNVGRVSKQVCKKYFLQTFLVSDGRLSRALRKEENEKEPGEDLRGRKPPANKTPQEQVDRVRAHINSFQRYDQHYNANAKGKYLRSDLNIKRMYNLYVEECQTKDIPFVKENIYRSIFNDEFKFLFLSPKRDPCQITFRKPNPTPRKKKAATNTSSMEPFDMRQQPNSNPLQPQKFPAVTASQLFCPTDNLKCAYNHLGAPTMVPPQDKNSHYPQCSAESILPNNYFHQEHNVAHQHYSTQTPSFFNL